MKCLTGATAQTIVELRPSHEFVTSILESLPGNTPQNARAIRIFKSYIADIDSGEIVPEPEPAKTPNGHPKGISKIKRGLMAVKKTFRKKPTLVAEPVPESVPESSGTLSASTFQLLLEHGISRVIIDEAIAHVARYPAKHGNATAYLHHLRKKDLRRHQA
jgi:hypothetical protein